LRGFFERFVVAQIRGMDRFMGRKRPYLRGSEPPSKNGTFFQKNLGN
jgi:hypothetical protein